jgi:hypothetical protein
MPPRSVANTGRIGHAAVGMCAAFDQRRHRAAVRQGYHRRAAELIEEIEASSHDR